ncbi:MAG: hypothetical protein UT24_C0034G0003 [Candidatus Woesebacteria bacterium GW2011_GWB1_39_12]|uniref:Peptidase C39 domain-containing protein n=1 Tax=Candidatus Woesebacteria bacterium GW2011_GWB1_39_12 TaxID=1618574 RepID=A0A0G0MER0_9BACT|nr:MAG: hypothetical protein UT24_C0034G0003 [Candidatus Woesebacteria bacterium GW2011_GWB1_39_12]
MAIKILCQRNPLWAEDKLGSSSLNVYSYGCTTCCISMLSDYFKCYKSPKEIAHNINNYTKDGLIIWKNLNFEKMQFIRRDWNPSLNGILNAVKNPYTAVILEVPLGKGKHWVVALRKDWFSNDFLIADPWDGKKKLVKKTYKNITGAAFFARK